MENDTQRTLFDVHTQLKNPGKNFGLSMSGRDAEHFGDTPQPRRGVISSLIIDDVTKIIGVPITLTTKVWQTGYKATASDGKKYPVRYVKMTCSVVEK